jgi:Xaa-Pro aminopeptidase
MVFTVEPGIYIPAEGFGIRLEDDLVIQESGEPFNLITFLLKRMKLKV